MKIKIVHMFPDLLNLYGDKGNILTLQKRCIWRGIDAEIKSVKGEDEINLSDCDILFLGGGSNHEQEIVLEKLKKSNTALKEYVENNGTCLFVCSGFQMAGDLNLLAITYKKAQKRASGNVIFECEIEGEKVMLSGFENHEYETDIGDLMPLGCVLEGFGNNSMGFEGARYKNVFASNLHGPLLPKNPLLCDLIIKTALNKKYGEDIILTPLDDNLERIASKNIISSVLGEDK